MLALGKLLAERLQDTSALTRLHWLTEGALG